MPGKFLRATAYKRAFACAVGALAAAPNLAHAHGFPILSVQIASALPILITAGSACILYSYDTNGNRTAQSVTTIGAGTTQWGSGTYGCFLWSAP